MLWSASLREKSPYAQIHIIPYILDSTLDSFLPSSPSPLLPFLLNLHNPSFSPQSYFHTRLHAWSISSRNSCSLLTLYISLFLCPPGRYHPVSPHLGLRQPHRTAPCETKAALVESVTISLVNIPLTSASVISSASSIANVEGVRFSHGSSSPNSPGFGRRERNKIAHPDSTPTQALLQAIFRDWVVTSAI